MPFWQLVAAVLAAFLVLIGVVGFVRYPRPLMLVVLGLLVLIPAAGFAGYALVPGPEPRPSTLLWLAFIPAVAGLVAGVWMLAWMSARRSALTYRNLELLSNGTLVAYGGLVLGLSDVLAMWQPVYAVANVLASALWAAAWIPPRWRVLSAEVAVDIRAPVSRVYGFLADPANWPRYQEDMESAIVRPPGPLAVGSQVVVTQRYHSHVQGPKLLPEAIQTVSVVTRLVPDSTLSMELADRPGSSSTMTFTAAGGGTRVVSRAHSVAPYRMAVFGTLIELRSQGPERRARAQRGLARLKEILEEEPSPG